VADLQAQAAAVATETQLLAQIPEVVVVVVTEILLAAVTDRPD
jgi:hypothetical protein